MRDTYAPSHWAQDAVRAIDSGNTAYQDKRRFNRKLLGAGIGAFGTAATGLVNYNEGRVAKDEKDAKKLSDQQKAIAAAKRAEIPPDPWDKPDYSHQMDSAVLHGQPYTPESIKALGKSLSSQIDANDAAGQAPIAGRWTEQGFQNGDMMAAVNGSDINRAKNAMQYGGLMNSSITDGPSVLPDAPDTTLTQPQMGRR